MALERARVLLADDHAEFLALAARIIEVEFDVVQTLESGESVVDRFVELNPDLLVLDISMPGPSGIETAQRVKAIRPNARIVFLTVHKDPDYLRSAMATSALGYVVKDRLASDLIPALKAALVGRTFVSSSMIQVQH